MGGIAAGGTAGEGTAAGAPLAAEALACRRGERLLFEKLDFVLPPGGLLLLTGPNGSGKSSLLRLLAGLLRPAAGRLTSGGQPVFEELGAYQARLHFLGHQEAAKPVLSGRENLEFWCRLRGAGTARIDAALAAFELEELAAQPMRLYSAGQKRRLALARLLAAPAPLWLLDEPSVGLDSRSVARLVAEIEAHRGRGGQVVLATHVDLGLAAPQSLGLAEHAPAPLELAEWHW
ncbi:heme exporter protein A [Tistlia consotensis]|uniref:Heme exporter protein A n=1 Tax=Tistlia consotensis USBA 355 TaxID=560819 RepID=A0A1Y6BNF6_9PROT|nr:heme ABC exporter ATP-binding protein CcmA [Tistlia consotensis]SMF11885.1 heme exporter protein A [Tistlia consotensis USBA 355]SNR51565.1 heme exporter protein A [Tistlia consotensis]